MGRSLRYLGFNYDADLWPVTDHGLGVPSHSLMDRRERLNNELRRERGLPDIEEEENNRL